MGQYLQPTPNHLDVVEYVPPEKFEHWRKYGEEVVGFRWVGLCSEGRCGKVKEAEGSWSTGASTARRWWWDSGAVLWGAWMQEAYTAIPVSQDGGLQVRAFGTLMQGGLNCPLP